MKVEPVVFLLDLRVHARERRWHGEVPSASYPFPGSQSFYEGGNGEIFAIGSDQLFNPRWSNDRHQATRLGGIQDVS
jgi:hypothetical protein